MMHLASALLVPIAVCVGVSAWTSEALGTNEQAIPGHKGSSGLIAPDVRPGNPVTSPEVRMNESEISQAHVKIDELIDNKIKEKALKKSGKTKDHEFLRRVYLDLAGRIPTAEEARNFLGSTKADKRSAVVRELLQSEAHVSHMFNFWADLLRIRNELKDNKHSGLPYADWVKNSIRQNKPYDKFVFELITANGHALARGNGATGYYIVDKAMPEDNMANTVRVFLGTRLSCAQCHDHPFDKWTRRDFFEMAGFTAGTDARANGGDITKAAKKLEYKIPYTTTRVSNEIGDTFGLTVSDKNPGVASLPKDYQYSDGRPGERIKPMTMFEEDILSGGSTMPRVAYAGWMTSEENKNFTLVIVNRMWKKLMRVGLIEPVDNLTDETVPANKELSDYLCRVMIGVKYDLRKFQEIICATEAYQRQTVTYEHDRFDFHYEGQPVGRLTAEQVWDSLMTLIVDKVDTHKGDNAEELYKFYERNKDKDLDGLARIAIAVGAIRDEIIELEGEIKKLKINGGSDVKIKQLQAQVDGLKSKDNLIPELFGSKNQSAWRRASELASPMPAGHFLRVFGQSDRTIIDNATDSVNLTQSLEMMNGMIENNILADDAKSVLRKAIDGVQAPSDKVKVLYLSILSRLPTSSELSYGIKVMSLAPRQRGPEYLGWALLNSAEFVFNQ